MKNKLKNWNLFEISFLSLSIILLTTFFIIGKDKNWLSFVVSVIGIVCVMFMAKGLIVAQFFNLVLSILYSVLSYTQHYFGEMIIYIGLMIPISVLAINSWMW